MYTAPNSQELKLAVQHFLCSLAYRRQRFYIHGVRECLRRILYPQPEDSTRQCDATGGVRSAAARSVAKARKSREATEAEGTARVAGRVGSQ